MSARAGIVYLDIPPVLAYIDVPLGLDCRGEKARFSGRSDGSFLLSVT